MGVRTKIGAGAAALALPLLLDQGVAEAAGHRGQLTYTDESGEQITCDYYGSSGIYDHENHLAGAYTENSINQQTTPGCEAEMVLKVTYIDTDGRRRQASASSVEGRSLYLNNSDVARDYVATHDIYYLRCRSPEPGDTCSVRFTTK